MSIGAITQSQERPASGETRWFLAPLACFLVLVNGLITWFAQQRQLLGPAFVAAAFCLNCYLACFFLLGHPVIQAWLVSRVSTKRSNTWLLLLGVLLAPYLIYAAGTDSFHWIAFAKFCVYLVLPAAVLTAHSRRDQLCWQDAAAILTLWLPLDFRWMQDVWGWPRHSLAYSMNSLLATCAAAFLFVCVRQLKHVGYEYKLDWRLVWIGARNFALFAPLAIPIGLVTGFIVVSERPAPLWQFLLSTVGIFLLIAIPEELLFRGLIQNLLGKRWLNPGPALLVTSLIFGAAHLNNGPRPDWRYFVLASIAGLFYGNAYSQTRNLLAPAITHSLVDAVWRAFFR